MSDTPDYLDGLDYPEDALEQSFALYLGSMEDVEAEVRAQHGPTSTNKALERLLEVEPQDHLRSGTKTPCMGAENPDAWFSNDRNERAEAIVTCWQCPVRVKCLAWAKRTKQQGVWGGIPLFAGRPMEGSWK